MPPRPSFTAISSNATFFLLPSPFNEQQRKRYVITLLFYLPPAHSRMNIRVAPILPLRGDLPVSTKRTL